MDILLEQIREFMVERENEVLVNIQKHIPAYKETVQILSKLNDGILKFLENDDTSIPLQMKKDILTYLDKKDEARMIGDIFLYLQGIADTIKIMKYLH